MDAREMDKPDLDFLVDSQDTDLLYKHILEAICSNFDRVRYGINRYTIDYVLIYSLNTYILYRSRFDSNIGKVNKYAMEL